MSNCIIQIDFETLTSHSDLIKILSLSNSSVAVDSVNFKLNLNNCNVIYSDYLLLIIASISFLKEKGLHVTTDFIDFNENSITDYASNVNFFKLLGFEHIKRNKSAIPIGPHTEIREFNDSNSLEIYENVIAILLDKDIDEQMMQVLHFCLWELIDNTINHSSKGFRLGLGRGFVCAQYFPNHQEIRLIIADTGVGIHYALTKHPDSKFKYLSEKEAVLHCIDKGVTNSTGMGFGLYATAEFIKRNKGELSIFSGNYHLICNQEIKIYNEVFWPGTFTFLKIKTKNPVIHRELFGIESTQADSFDELKSKINRQPLDLW